MSKFRFPEKTQVVFFTLLGTLCQTHPSVVTKFFQVLSSAGLNTTHAQVRESFHKAESWIYLRKNAGWPLNDQEAARYKRIFYSSLGVKGELADHYDQILFSSLEKSRFWTKNLKIAKETTPLLVNLSEHNVKCGLILNSDLRAAKILNQLGIREYFQEIFSPGSIGVSLPHPQILQVALSSFKLRASRCLLVGSRPQVEGEGAKAGNFPYVLLATGADDMFEQPKDSFKGYNVVESFFELNSCFQKSLTK
ncbi:MAG: HAD family hydrolase [Candidatus Hodarchaeota archaeon]